MAKKSLPRIIETLALTNRGHLLAQPVDKLGQPQHEKETEYEIIGDSTEGNFRTISLKIKDRTERDRKIAELIEAISIKLGEPDSKTLRAILLDALIQRWDESIDNLYNLIVTANKPVKPHPGCFKLIIGDGRRKSSETIMLTDMGS